MVYDFLIDGDSKAPRISGTALSKLLMFGGNLRDDMAIYRLRSTSMVFKTAAELQIMARLAPDRTRDSISEISLDMRAVNQRDLGELLIYVNTFTQLRQLELVLGSPGYEDSELLVERCRQHILKPEGLKNLRSIKAVPAVISTSSDPIASSCSAITPASIKIDLMDINFRLLNLELADMLMTERFHGMERGFKSWL